MVLGQTLGHYRILEKLGAGGMGEVYLAEDTTLKRRVALKVLPAELATSQERLERFQREAETLAALDHPNIVTIHSVEEVEGVRFLTMQLVEGKPLSDLIPKGGMPLERIFDIAIPLADALAAAHEKGVIHRDLKPGNIMVTKEGRVKVLDFGLAKLRQEAAVALATELPTEPLTDEGKIVGTMPYMSPEQLEGKEIDARSDIFALGVVLYEMATGERPFKGDSSASLITAIMSHSPREVDSLRAELPHHLSRIVRHCLEKDPTKRYQSALDVRNELQDLHREESSAAAEPVRPEPRPEPPKKRMRWPLVAAAVAGAAIVLIALISLWLNRSQPPTEPPTEALGEPAAAVEAKPPMIVVLPFENLGDPEDEYFADGMTEEITSRLAVVSGLRVISRTSAMQYKEDRPSLKQVGEELGVDYVLEGSVRWAKTESGGRVRITPQLIRVADDSHLWADSYDRVLEDIFAIQSDIAKQIVHQLGVSLLEPERLRVEGIPTDNLEAYQAFLRANELDRSQFPAPDDIRAIERQLDRAVKLDPGFVLAWAKLASFQFLRYWYTGDSERLERGRSALDRALALDPRHPAVLVAQGDYHWEYLEDFDRALIQYLQAAEIAPSEGEVHWRLADLYRDLGQWEESLAAWKRSLELDPRNSRAWNFQGTTYDALGRFAEAQASYDQALVLAPDLVDAYRLKAWSLLFWRGDFDGARRVLEQCPRQDHFYVVSIRAWLHYYKGEMGQAVELLADHRFDARHFEGRRLLALGLALRRIGQAEAAREAFEAVVALHEDEAESVSLSTLWRRGTNPLHELTLAYALLGQHEKAHRLVEAATAEVHKSAYHGPQYLALMAWVSMWTGDEEGALSLMEEYISRPRSLQGPYGWGITPAVLRYHPDLDPLRDHPRFQTLLEKYE